MRVRDVLIRAVVVVLAIGLSGCAVGGGTGAPAGQPAGQPAARIGLPAPMRVFYDELEPYGDWILIEPYGWVFRPDVNTVAWRPYQDGWWEPTDTFGWVWNSDEPFGWITYHYGYWFYDRYQGWVWQPTSFWGPAWVAWVDAGDYVGWAPLPPPGLAYGDDVPGGLFLYAPAQTLSQQDVGANASFVNAVAARVSDVRPVLRVGRYQGSVFNMGPDPHQLLGTSRPFDVDESGLKRVPIAGGTTISETAIISRTNSLAGLARRQVEAVRNGRPLPPAPSGPRAVWRTPPRPTTPPDTLRAKPRERAPRLGGPARAPRDSTAARDSTKTRLKPAQADSSRSRRRGPKPPPHYVPASGDGSNRG